MQNLTFPAGDYGSPKSLVIHRVAREEGEAELKRASGALFWSGRVAGLSMGFSFLAPALLEARPLDVPSSAILAGFSCCVGFVITILGEQQPFTELTQTAVLQFLVRRNGTTFPALMRM